ncbi:heme exporter protein CcmD [Aestuariibacter halophilus]|uniref:Heme exporter protein D n=1 Tax=Fluctibacter halophilus TaxID=226011 RepID=A0ABS8G2I2_9ALTE|nr:heme exporter protein CcmD [Aestuariibacter halophilus]MCC2614792.1 heme exporter protein CcmD [Aestuariibacter halophilus]
MQFDSWQAFVDMGGYGFFVWLSFGVTALAMLGSIVESRVARRRLIKALHEEVKRQERIAAAKGVKRGLDAQEVRG